jgi:hypothetical protein
VQGLRGHGLVTEIYAPELAFGIADVEALLCQTVGHDPPGLARRVRGLNDPAIVFAELGRQGLVRPSRGDGDGWSLVRAHLALIKVLIDAGRFGQAHHYHRNYVRRMTEIDIEPSPLSSMTSRIATS